MLRRRPHSRISSEDQWRRCVHDGTALVDGAVQLPWTEASSSALEEFEPGLQVGGLDFDRRCRAYRTIPEDGRVERLPWADAERGAVDVFAAPPAAEHGDFRPHEGARTPSSDPRALAIDDDGRLFLAETGNRRVLVFDLLGRRLLRSIEFDAPPLDLASSGREVWALLGGAAPRVARFGARSAIVDEPLATDVTAPARIERDPRDGALLVLDRAGTADARIHAVGGTHRDLAVPFATDLTVRALDAHESELVVARGADEELPRFAVAADAIEQLPPLRARGYDGRGIAFGPDGRVAYVRAGVVRQALLARPRFATSGRVVTFRLDSGEFGARWGRLALEGCMPRGTSVRVHAIVADEPPAGAELAPSPPVNAAHVEIRRPDLTPPLLPAALEPPATEPGQALAVRDGDPFESFARVEADDPFRWYEAPVLADRGRYLWLVLELRGTSRRSPRVRAVTVERPGHDLLDRIPAVFSRDPFAADFLQRFLAPAEGELSTLYSHAAERHVLLDPRSAPEEMLPWLASFVGLTLDERLSAEQKRTLVSEATWLFRFRGTVDGLTRLLEIVAGAPVLVVEHFRLRGLGVGLVGDPDRPTSSSILGAGFRVGGGLDGASEGAEPGAGADAFAHRFTVVVRAPLTEHREAVVRHALEVHRPAHTLYELCSTSAGMRVGRGLHVGLTAILGETSGFDPLVLGQTLLGRHAVVGQPRLGTAPGGDRTGRDTHVG